MRKYEEVRVYRPPEMSRSCQDNEETEVAAEGTAHRLLEVTVDRGAHEACQNNEEMEVAT